MIYGPVDGSIVQYNVIVSRIPGQALLFEKTTPAPKNRGNLTPAMLRTCKADHNLYFNTSEPGWGQKHLDAQRRFGIEQDSVEADPQFADPEKDDFSVGLSSNSPAQKVGFEPIDISRVGPRKE